jgi:hypothetical protein
VRIRPKGKAKARPKPKGKGGKAKPKKGHVTAAQRRRSDRERSRRRREKQAHEPQQAPRHVTAELAPVSPVAEPADVAPRVTPLAILTVLSLAVAVGAYSVLYGVLEPLYHGTGAALRALVPLAVEMIAGYAAHAFIGGKLALPPGLRVLLAVASVAVILACGWTELDAARAAPAVAARDRVGHVLEQAASQQQGTVTTQEAPESEGRQGKLQHERNQGAALELQGKRDDYSRKLTQQQLANASKTTAEEGRLPTELALLGAIGSASFIPLLEAFLSAVRAALRRKGGSHG